MRTRQLSKQRTVCPKQAGGFTLIELMVAIAILAILLGIAVPSFSDATLGSKLSSYANNFVASVNLARSEAIKRNTTVTLCASGDGSSCATSGGWEQGWIVACNTTSPSTVCNATGTDLLIFHRQQAMPGGFKISESSAGRSIQFTSTGVGANQATLTICRATPTVGTAQRQINVWTTGRATVTKTNASTCS